MSPHPPLPDQLNFGPTPLRSSRFVRTAIVHFVMLTGFAALLLQVVPSFTKIFKDFGVALPVVTVFLIDVSNGLKNRWYWAVPFIPPYFAGLHYLVRTDREWAQIWTMLLVAGFTLSCMFAALALSLPLMNLMKLS